jgi:hypothetical protein
MLGRGVHAQRAQLPHRHLVGKAADRHGRHVIGLDRGHALAIHVVGDHRLARARELEEARRQVDRVSGHRVRAVDRASGIRGDHFAARHADVGG